MLRRAVNTLAVALGFAGAGCAQSHFYKGNLHTHSLWTDGTDFPEMIAMWYRGHGYNFLGITEHNMLQEGAAQWVDVNAKDEGWPPRNQSARAALPGYIAVFGKPWVEERVDGARHFVRLKPLTEYRTRFEQSGRFIFVMGEEITDRNGAHINAFNLTRAVPPQGGADGGDRTRNNLRAIALQGDEILAVVNHPNYVWALTPEQLADAGEARFFEIYSGHALVNVAGDATHPGTDRFWDIALTRRMKNGGRELYGVATDDAHDYREYSDTIARPGRGWIVVRAKKLTFADLNAAMNRGDFYASNGVMLRNFTRDAEGIRIEIAPERDVTFRTQFIGYRGNEVGEVLYESGGLKPEYRFRGDELYVRAKVMSSRGKSAWLQPVVFSR